MTTFQYDQNLEDKFVALVEESWQLYDGMERNGWLDDVFVGAIITAHLDAGMFMLSIVSDGSAHFVTFSDQNRNRHVVRVDHGYGEDYLFSKTVGHLSPCTFGVGRAYDNLSKVMTAAKAEMKSDMAAAGAAGGFVDPGVMKIDIEGTIAVCETTLLLKLDDYVDLQTLKVDTEKLWTHIQATYQSLEKYLSGIMA